MNDTPENITISVKFAALNEIIITDIFIIEMAMEIFLFFLYVFLLIGWFALTTGQRTIIGIKDNVDKMTIADSKFI